MSTTTTNPDAVLVPRQPAMSGLVFRRFRGPHDLPGMTEANMAAREAYGIEETVSTEAMAVQYANLSNSDVAHDLLIIELDGRIVGYVRVQWNDQHDGSRAYESVAILRPELRGQGIGSSMLAWIEQRNRELAAAHPDDGRPRWLQAGCWDGDAYATRLLLRHGYEAVRRGFEMVRPTLDDLPEVHVPDGLELRAVTSADYRRIWEAAVEAFRDHWGGSDESEADWLRFSEDPRYEPTLMVVAFAGDEVAGAVVNVLDRADETDAGEVKGVLDAVFVRRPWRRRGLASALVAQSLHVLRERGATRAVLGVDGENPNQAMTLYERAGFRIATSQTVWRKPLSQET